MESVSKPSPTASNESVDVQTDAFLHAAAKAEGLTVHQFNQKYGIVGPSQERRIRRHEVTEAQAKFEQAMEIRKKTGDRYLDEHAEGRH